MSGKDSITSKVINRIVGDKFIKLFEDEHGDPFIAPNGDGTQIYAIGSSAFSDWLMPFVMDEFSNQVLIGDQAKNITETLRGYAKYRGEGKFKLSLRFHEDEYGNFWYDLGREAVKIQPNRWSVEAYPPIMFTRFADCQKSQVVPKHGGDIMDLFKFINVEDKYDRLLIIAFIVFSLVPYGNKPILSLSGQAGSGKTEASKTIKSLVDPTVPLITSLSDKTDELDRMAQTNAVMAFDNLSGLSTRMSDHWCKLATGLGVRIKKYYVTSEYITFEAIRPIIANGISQTLVQSDVLNRAIPVELTPLKKRIDDQEFRKQFEVSKPFLLGAMFTLLSKAMATYQNVPQRDWPRMGTFSKWGWAITESLDGYCGDDFIIALDKVTSAQHDEAIIANPVAQAISLFMGGIDVWKDTAAELLYQLNHNESTSEYYPKYTSAVENQLRELRYTPYWPKDPRGLSVALRKVIPDLKSIGIDVEIDIREDNKRLIRITNNKIISKKEPVWTEAQLIGLRED